MVRKLFARYFRCRIDRSTAFIDHHDGCTWHIHFTDKILRFTSGCTITNSNCFNIIRRYQTFNNTFSFSLASSTIMREDCRIFQQIALRIQNHSFTSSPESWVNSQ
ncbi:Uncharacterised protein [Mycobacterium tuberculosis]|nr:Uncharacterised protein [Mycobacterium tuberculosis]